MTITPLGFALIGLLIAIPRSGYDLRKVFEISPLGVYSSSPGSIYPVLTKLMTAGLIEKRPLKESTKEIYHPTAKGRAEIRKWLASPVRVSEVARDIDTVLLRFAFLETVGDVNQTRNFLESFKEAISAHLEGLRSFMKSPEGTSLSRHGKLAMENGIGGFESQLAWSVRAQAAFSS